MNILRFVPRSLFFRLSLAVSLVMVVVFGASSYITFRIQSEQSLSATKTQAILLTRALKNTIRIGMESGHTESLASIFQTVGALPGVEKLRVFNEEGKIRYSMKPSEVGHLTDELDYTVYRSPERSTPFQSETTGHRSFCMVEPIENEAKCQRCHPRENEVLGVLDVCLSMGDTEKSIEYNRFLLLSFTWLAVILTSALISVILKRFVTAPVERLARTMESVEAGKLDVRVDIRSGDELGRLGGSFNEMVRKLSDTRAELEKFHHRQLARADRMASLGEMAAGIAHEIKNPLAGIYGAAQVLVNEFPEGDPKREIVGEMMTLIKRLDGTIRDLLNFARYTEPQFSRANVNEVIDKVLFLVQQIPEGKRARIVRDFDPAMPEIEMDSEQMKQVFLNLALNAVQAKPDGVALTVRTRGEVPADIPEAKHRSGYVMASVSDDGPGIPADRIGKVFQPFFTTKESGTGLGLSMTRKILDLHDGWITAESGSGGGATFTVFLPKVRA
ncbi:MAG: HAMP domain-containing protein [Deltaproteobacteria bacterium]|nr:MAG: HAMP domain-containing protein [Deltaproteobacteria bacterium]